MKSAVSRAASRWSSEIARFHPYLGRKRREGVDGLLFNVLCDPNELTGQNGYSKLIK